LKRLTYNEFKVNKKEKIFLNHLKRIWKIRIKIKDSVITIPDKLIKNMDQLDIETANAINTLLRKDERIISQKVVKKFIKPLIII